MVSMQAKLGRRLSHDKKPCSSYQHDCDNTRLLSTLTHEHILDKSHEHMYVVSHSLLQSESGELDLVQLLKGGDVFGC